MDQPLTTSKPCEVHSRHLPKSHVNERHHVWPLGEDGPDIPENIVVVCATGHNNIHKLLRLMLVGRGMVPYAEARTYTWQERQLAKLGYERIMRKAM